MKRLEIFRHHPRSDRQRLSLYFFYFFLLLLVATLLLSFSMFAYTDNLLRQDYYTNYENTFTLLRHSHDLVFNQMEHAIRGLFDNKKYESFLTYYQNNKMLKSIEVLDDLTVIESSLDALENICLYYPEGELTLSIAQSVAPLSMYHDRDFLCELPGIDDLSKRTFSRKIQYVFSPMPIDVVTFIRTVPLFSVGRQPVAYAVIDIKSDILYEPFQEIELGEKSNFLIFDASENLIHAQGEALPLNVLGLDMEKLDENALGQKTEINGRSFYAWSACSDKTGWIYVYLQDIQTFEQPLLRLRKAFGLFALATLLLGATYSFFASRKLNLPIQRISNRLSGFQEDADVFAQIDQLITRNEKLDTELANNAVMGKNQQLLRQLLLGFIPNMETAGCLQLQDEEQECLLFLLRAASGNDSLSSERLGEMLKKYRLRLVVKLYSQKREIALILAGAKSEKDEALSAAQNILQSFPGTIEAIGISQSFSEVGQIAEAYHQASTALGMELVRGSGSICHYQDILNPPALSYPYRLENVIFHAIKTFNRPALEESMQRFEQYLVKNDARARVVRNFYMQLFSSTQQLVLEIASRCEDFIGFNHHDLLEPYHISEMSAYMMHIFELLIQSSEQISRDENELVDKVCAFIEEHLDNMPTQEALAEEFFISLKVLRAEFRRVKDMSIKSYIDQLKIEKSKQMLLDPQKKIQKIAGAMGFNYSQSFIAFFKSFTGVTPGEWREAAARTTKNE